MLDSFFAPWAGQGYAVHDDREVDEQSGPNPDLDRILSRELVVRGEGLFSTTPNLDVHGLNKVDIATSSAKRGVCYQMVPCSEGDEGAVLVTSNLRGQEVAGYYIRQELPTKTKLMESVAGLSEEEARKMRVALGAANLAELVEMLPHQDRADRIIIKAAYYASGDDRLDSLSTSTVLHLRYLLEKQMKAIRNGQKPDNDDLNYLLDFIPDGKDLNFLHDFCEKAHSAVKVRMEILGVEHDNEGLLAVEPKPEEVPNWGLPLAIMPWLRSPATWKRYCEKGYVVAREWFPPMDRYAMNDFAMQFGIKEMFETGMGRGSMPPSFREVQSVIAKIEQDYQEKVGAWEHRQNPENQWETLGDLVSRLSSWTGDGIEGLHDGADVRPRPSFVDGPIELGDADETYLQQMLLQGSTPEDITLWMGDTAPFADELPYGARKKEEGIYDVGGHPMCEAIHSFMRELEAPRDPMALSVVEDASEIARIRLPNNFRLDTVQWNGRTVRGFLSHPALVVDDYKPVSRFGVRVKRIPEGLEVLEVEAGAVPPYYFETVKFTDKDGEEHSWNRKVPQPTLVVGDIICFVDGEEVGEDWRAQFEPDEVDIIAVRKNCEPIGLRMVKKVFADQIITSEKPNTGVPVIIDEDTIEGAGNNSYTVKARFYYPKPDPVVRKLKEWNGNKWVLRNPKDPFLRYFAGVPFEDIPRRLTFLSRVQMAAYRLPVLMTPTFVINDEGEMELTWREVREVFPELCEWVKQTEELYTGGFEGVDHHYTTWTEKLQNVNWELRSYQKEMFMLLIQQNWDTIIEPISLLQQIQMAAILRPDSLTERNWGYNNDQSLWQAYFASGGEFWSMLSRLQGQHNEISLPKEMETNPELVWRALGYKMNGDYGIRDARTLERMIERAMWRHNVLSPRSYKMRDMTIHRPALLEAEVNPWAFSNGIVGDVFAQTMSMVFPPQVPGFSEAFRPTREDFEAAGSLNGAIERRIARVFSSSVWGGMKTYYKARPVIKGWNRYRPWTGQPNQERAVNAIIESIFSTTEDRRVPNPKVSLTLEEERTGVSQKTIEGFTRLNQMKVRQARRVEQLYRRLLARSTQPTVAASLLKATQDSSMLRSIGGDNIVKVLDSMSDDLGPIATVLRQRLNG